MHPMKMLPTISKTIGCTVDRPPQMTSDIHVSKSLSIPFQCKAGRDYRLRFEWVCFRRNRISRSLAILQTINRAIDNFDAIYMKAETIHTVSTRNLVDLRLIIPIANAAAVLHIFLFIFFSLLFSTNRYRYIGMWQRFGYTTINASTIQLSWDLLHDAFG